MSKKRTLGRIAAVSLAGMTAVSSMAILASADLTTSTDNLSTANTVSGSLVVAKWFLGYKATHYTAVQTITNSTKGTIAINASGKSYTDSTSTIADSGLAYGAHDSNVTEYDSISGGAGFTASAAQGVYYATTAQANVVINELKSVATYQNTYGYDSTATSTNLTAFSTADTVYLSGGTNAYSTWSTALANYVKTYNSYVQAVYDYNNYAAMSKYSSDKISIPDVTFTSYCETGAEGKSTTVYYHTKGTEGIEGSLTFSSYTTLSDSDLAFEKKVYTLTSSLSTLSLSSIADLVATLSIDAETGEVDIEGTDYTVVTSSSSSSSSTTSTTTTYNTYYPSSSTYRTASTVSYLGNNGYWYTSSTAAATYGNGYSGTYKSSNYDSSSGYVYYSADTGYYYTTSTLAAAAGSHYYAITDSTSTSWYPTSSTYRTASTTSYLGSNGYWYTSSTAASTYGGGYTGTTKTSNYSSVSSYDTLYFSASTGNYYTTSSSAGSYSYSVSKSTTSSTDDPYYYYYLMGTTSSSSSTTEEGAPTIYGSTKRSGWTKITSYINARSNTTVSIDMNETYTIPASVLAAAKSNNITLKIYNDNGSRVTIAPGDVDTSSALNVGITYNVKTIKSSLVAAAKKVNSGTVSTAQIQVGEDGSLGGTVTATVKMSTKRAGDTVKAYRLTSAGKLTREATGTVGSDGRVSFKLKNGGTYLLVVIE